MYWCYSNVVKQFLVENLVLITMSLKQHHLELSTVSHFLIYVFTVTIGLPTLKSTISGTGVGLEFPLPRELGRMPPKRVPEGRASPARWLGERCKLPCGVRGGALSANAFPAFLKHCVVYEIKEKQRIISHKSYYFAWIITAFNIK